jgi:hypothetical protein
MDIGTSFSAREAHPSAFFDQALASQNILITFAGKMTGSMDVSKESTLEIHNAENNPFLIGGGSNNKILTLQIINLPPDSDSPNGSGYFYRTTPFAHGTLYSDSTFSYYVDEWDAVNIQVYTDTIPVFKYKEKEIELSEPDAPTYELTFESNEDDAE